MATGFLLLVLAGIAYLLWRYRQGQSSNGQVIDQRYHAVSIEQGLICCRHVEKLQHQRYLSHEAPHIPLPGCDQPTCQCRYKHHSDRRNRHNDRRDIYGVKQALFDVLTTGERRKTRDRRATPAS
ncbi:hypothetical protein [Corallincola spongiicola]|uniref:Uncharacterized protein n=1 Tax=Corallincola spongiicola TaxID=2520508 RepID=A0ABY1WRI9_9GAMM|nr:hypothetical protein [Corallincola spongiicola]TAA47240.1 hypothetical protein EXY25_08355 [Corallincola spongiicola]